MWPLRLGDAEMPPRRLAAGLLVFASLADAQEPQEPQEPAGCHTYAGCWAQPSGAAAWFDAQTTFRSYALYSPASPLSAPFPPPRFPLPRPYRKMAFSFLERIRLSCSHLPFSLRTT